MPCMSFGVEDKGLTAAQALLAIKKNNNRVVVADHDCERGYVPAPNGTERPTTKSTRPVTATGRRRSLVEVLFQAKVDAEKLQTIGQ